MNHYDRDNILDLCSRSHRLASSLAQKVGMDQEEIAQAEQGLHLMADRVSRALCNRPLYTVSIARLSNANAIEYENALTTPLLEEAVRLRDDINQDIPLFGAKRIAHIIRREVRPRKWELFAQISESEIHLRCQVTNARALLRSAPPEVIANLYFGKTLVQDRSIYLQSERIEVTIHFTSTRRVSVTRGGGRIVTHDVKVCTPAVANLDITCFSELSVDTRGGVLAKFAVADGKVTLPGDLAMALRLDGSALLLGSLGNGRIKVRLTSRELVSRLELSLVLNKRSSESRFLRPTHYPTSLLAA